MLFERLNDRPGKNVAGILASADVLVTRGPPLQPGPGFYEFEALILGLEKYFPFTFQSPLSPRGGIWGGELVNRAGLPELVLQSLGSREEGNARLQTSAPLLLGCGLWASY